METVKHLLLILISASLVNNVVLSDVDYSKIINVSSTITINKGYSSGTTRPTSPYLGEYFFDTSINKPIWWTGSIWVLSDGTSA